MKKNFTLKTVFALSLVAGVAGSLTSCKDYEGGDVSYINEQFTKLTQQFQQLNQQVEKVAGQVCNCEDVKITANPDGSYTVTNKSGVGFTYAKEEVEHARKDNLGYYVVDKNGNKVYIPEVVNGKLIYKGNSYDLNGGSTSSVSATINGDKITITADGKTWEFDKSTVGCGWTMTKNPTTGKWSISDGTQTVEIPESCKCSAQDLGNGTVKVTIGGADYILAKPDLEVKTEKKDGKDIIVITHSSIKDAQGNPKSDTLFIPSEKDLSKYLTRDSLSDYVTKDALDTIGAGTKTELKEIIKNLYGEGGTAAAPAEGSLADRVNKTEEQANANADSIKSIQNELYGDGGTAADPKPGSVVARLDNLEDIVEALNERVTDIEDALKKDVKNIIIQQVASEVLGSYNSMLTNGMTTYLIGVYGEAKKAVDFPTVDNPIVSLDAGDIIPDDHTVMGRITMTINPIERDFTSLYGLKLVNSIGGESVVSLSPVKKSYEVLNAFPGSRSWDNNGLYEVTAYLPKANYGSEKCHIAVDKSAIKQAVKDLKEKKVSAALSDIADAIQTTAKSLQNIDKLGIQITWEDSLGKHGVMSEARIAPIAYKPLPFTVFDGLNNLPGYSKMITAIDKIKSKIDEKVINKINNRIYNYADKLNQRGILKVEADDKGNFLVTVSYYGNADVETSIKEINEGYIAIGKEPIIVSHDAEKKKMVVRLEVTDINSFIDGIALNDLATLNKMIADLVDEMTGKIDNYEQKLYSKVMTYLNKINTKGTNLMHKVAHPVLFVSSDAGTSVASVQGVKPVVVKGTVKVVPTTYSAGLIAPTYKRYIEVNGVGQMVEDNTVDITSLLKTGDNTIKYYALDYEGNKEVITYVIEKK